MRIVAVFVWCLVLSTSAAMAATLNVALLQPKPVITSLDAVKLSASTNEWVFSSTAFRIISSFSRNGNDILWDIRSEPTFNQGAAIVLEMYHSNTLNPLPSGDYRLQVNWAHTGSGTILGTPEAGKEYWLSRSWRRRFVQETLTRTGSSTGPISCFGSNKPMAGSICKLTATGISSSMG